MTKDTFVEIDSGADTLLPLFDNHGRRIPPALSSPVNQVSRRYFRIEQPELDSALVFERISRYLGPPVSLTPEEFAERVQAIRNRLTGVRVLASMVAGVCVPFFLPAARHADIGEALDNRYLPSVDSSFSDAYPQFSFTNHNPWPLTGKLEVQAGSRHDELIGTMRNADVVGCYFPCLTEFSVPAALEQMVQLPRGLLLAGGYDTCAALVGSPSLLKRNSGYPNMLWLAALRAEEENVGYYFEAYGQNLTFNRRAHFGQVSEYWASGISVIG